MSFNCPIVSGRQTNGMDIDLTEQDVYTEKDNLEIQVNGAWSKVTPYIFRSWGGLRRINGEPYEGPVFYVGSTRRAPDPAATALRKKTRKVHGYFSRACHTRA